MYFYSVISYQQIFIDLNDREFYCIIKYSFTKLYSFIQKDEISYFSIDDRKEDRKNIATSAKSCFILWRREIRKQQILVNGAADSM